MSPALQELDERVHRVAGRAVVSMQLTVRALLGKAGIGKVLAVLSADELERVLVVASEWDADDDDANDPSVFTLHYWSEHWQELHEREEAAA